MMILKNAKMCGIDDSVFQLQGPTAAAVTGAAAAKVRGAAAEEGGDVAAQWGGINPIRAKTTARPNEP